MRSSLSSLTFGAEFETKAPAHFTREHAARVVAAASGVTVQTASRAGVAPTWKVVSDVSINGNGMEFVSPVLSGQAGLDQVTAICKALNDLGFTIDTSCGFHVHVGVGSDAPVEFFKNLIKLYGKFETEIDTLHAPSRRGNAAYYCRSVKDADQARFDAARTASDVARSVRLSSGADSEKYHKVNLIPAGKPTVEFRQHAGTVDGKKAVNWIECCISLVLAARQGRTGDGIAIARDFSGYGIKTRTVAEMISRPQGASLDEICNWGGWQRMGIKRHAQLAGFTFRKHGQRYFIVNEAGSAVPATIDGLFDLIEATPELRTFFAERRQRLAR